MDLYPKHKIAMVAASSRGLGFGVASALAREGVSLSITGQTIQSANAAAERLRAETGTSVIACEMRAADPHTISAWIDKTILEFGGVDYLVTNAGGPPPGPFESFTDADWQLAFETNLLGTVRMIRGVLPHMERRGGGSILAITSVAVKEPVAGLVLSNSVRAGVGGLVKTLSVELAAKNIRINSILPGRIDTDRVRHLDNARAERMGTTAEICRGDAEKSIPLGRYGTIYEFGRAAAFLLSDAASYITGSSIPLDGGSLKAV